MFRGAPWPLSSPMWMDSTSTTGSTKGTVGGTSGSTWSTWSSASGPRTMSRAVRYFTALVMDDPAALARQRAYPDALSAHSSAIEIILGRYQTKTMVCRQCGDVWTSYEEKETDVNIAVSLVADAAASGSDIALIISADSDLCPAIRTARSLNPGRGMIAAFPPRRSSFEIRSLIRGAFTVAAVDLRKPFCRTRSATRLPVGSTSGQASGADTRPPGPGAGKHA